MGTSETGAVLGSSAIRERLDEGEIFVSGTWNPNCIKEASYTLRVARDGLVLGGRVYGPGKEFENELITIHPGEVAILSTMERLRMPRDIVGHPGIRLNYAFQGLTGLMGIQVDPAYGLNSSGERLYLRVANFGNEDVTIQPGDAVFNIEFKQVIGEIYDTPRDPTWNRLLSLLSKQTELSWSYVTRVQNELDQAITHSRADLDRAIADSRSDLSRQIDLVRQGLQPLILFGVFLIATTLIGVTFAALFSLRDTPTTFVPNWITSWGWIMLATVISIAALATAAIGIAAAFLFITEAVQRWRQKS